MRRAKGDVKWDSERVTIRSKEMASTLRFRFEGKKSAPALYSRSAQPTFVRLMRYGPSVEHRKTKFLQDICVKFLEGLLEACSSTAGWRVVRVHVDCILPKIAPFEPPAPIDRTDSRMQESKASLTKESSEVRKIAFGGIHVGQDGHVKREVLR